MPPTTSEDWLDIANERAADAEAMTRTRGESTGCVYMAGYAIECSLKALLRRKNEPFPTSGRSGHNLRELWEASFKLRDLYDPTGAKSFFIESWNTSLRYELTCCSKLKVGELVDGAKSLSGWIQTQIRRRSGRRR
ncbi:MAG: HEPN domain-containing protein [Chloroflexaceae bacterium]|nr:HEPN domain-containing protein [Chloroflexaceae bacterium]